MRIVQIPRRFVQSDWGGTETVILEMSKGLQKLGHHTEIICPCALSTPGKEMIDGVPVSRLNYFYPYWGLTPEARLQLDRKGGNLFSFSLLRELYRYPDLDLIHLHTGKRLGAIGAYVAAKRKLPYVISLHGGVYDVPAAEAQTWTAPTKGTFEWGKALGWWTGARRVLDNASAILCVGQNEQAEVQSRFPRKNVIHLPNGVDAQRFASGDGAGFRARHSIPASAFVIVVVGRIDPQKNQLLALRILAEMRRGGLHAHLVLIGPVTNADYDATLNREIEAGGLTEFVTLIRGLRSHDPELVNAYHAASLFLLPSIHEPFGIVILEAWAAGLPVVASRVGGVPSFVIDGEDGALFPPDDLDAACSLVRHLAANPEARLRLANAGQKKARLEFGWDRISKRVEGIYEEAARANSLRK